MKGTKSRKVNRIQEVNNFRELLQMVEEKYKKNIAYQYKEEVTMTNPQYKEVTYETYVKDIKALSTSLLALGLEKKKVAIIGNNRYEWCTSYMATTTGNMVIVPLDRALPDNEIEALIKRSEVEAVIFDQKFMDIMLKLKNDKQNNVNILINMDKGKIEGVENYQEIIQKGYKLLEKGDNQYEKLTIDSHKMSVMLFTSGTTNLPKAVMLSQNNICSNICAVASFVKLYETDKLLSFLPIHHTFECTITFLYGMYSGSTVVFGDGLRYIQKNLQEYKISIFVAVPVILETMYKKIQKGIEEQGKTKLVQKMLKISQILLKGKIDIRKLLFRPILNQLGGNLRLVLYGAAPMNRETIIGYNNLGVDLVQGYGLTETSPVISAETDKEKRPGSVGLVFDNLEVKIENPNEEGIGEITVKGPSVMLGYDKNEEETKKVLKDGWLKTGDFGYLDKDEFLYVTGRKKDIIVLKNGKNVYPQEIEFLINKLPYVKESLVFERAQSETDTMLCAKIVYDQVLLAEEFGEATEEEYKDKIWEQIKEINHTLPIYKHIKSITITTKELSKTTTQKVKRYEELEKIK